MTDTRTQHLLTHNALAEHVSHSHVSQSLASASVLERNAVRCTILHNVLSGRVAGLIHRQGAADITTWLHDYVHLVYTTFVRERPAWQSLLKSTSTLELDPLLGQLDTAAQQVLRSVRARYPDADIQVEELINEAYVDLRVQRSLLDYPFDVPFGQWLRQCIWSAAKRLYGATQHLLPLQAADDEIGQRVSVLAQQRAGVGDDTWLSAVMAMATLVESDRSIVNDMLAHVHASETARRLGVSLATVYARRKRIVAQLQSQLRDQGE